MQRDTRADDRSIYAVEGVGTHAQVQFNLRESSTNLIQEGWLIARIYNHEIIATMQMFDARKACNTKTNDCCSHLAISISYLNFRVDKPTNTNTRVMIQKRTITLGSGQPFNSKW